VGKVLDADAADFSKNLTMAPAKKSIMNPTLEFKSIKPRYSYLYFILRNKIDSAKIRVIPFARTTGKSLIKNP